jgi:hypothetical protein
LHGKCRQRTGDEARGKLGSMRCGMFVHDRKVSLTQSWIGTSLHLLIDGQIMRGAF